jgi:transcriptional regulator with XRE-family HTH domain
MTAHELQAARLKRGLVQAQVAESLGVSQAYVNMLENGKRRLTSGLTRRVSTLYRLSPKHSQSQKNLRQHLRVTST